MIEAKRLTSCSCLGSCKLKLAGEQQQLPLHATQFGQRRFKPKRKTKMEI